MNTTNACIALAGSLVITAAAAAGGGWVSYTNETSIRLITDDSQVGAADTQEKQYGIGDFDQDGDMDVAVVRKNPFTTAGGRRNVLFMNEGVADGRAVNGVLVDSTSDYNPDFLDLTNDRDLVVVDVNGDGWLDIVTATTLGGLSNPKSVTHPRVYINLQDDETGDWLGFAFDDVDRIPTFPFEPRFCAVAAGDIDNDDDQDLYFVDYDSGPYSRGGDLNDRLLINDGTGYFTDQSAARMTPAMLQSGFGSACEIVDTNGNGWLDVVKSENGPAKTINNGGNGFFNLLETTYSGAAYHVSYGYLNNDGMVDLIISDDGTDRYLLNTGNGPNSMADYSTQSFPGSTNGFGSDSYTVDLDNDGWNDVIICDVDVDAPGCTRVSDILHSNGNGPTVTFTADAGNLPSSALTGVHDIAAVDLNGDTYLDLLIGRCTGTAVWMNAPPIGMTFEYPQGLPDVVEPETATVFQAELIAAGDTIEPGSETLHVSINDGPYAESPLVLSGGNTYLATLPPGACADRFDFYVSVQLSGGLSFTDPPAAPVTTYTAIAAETPEIVFEDHIEGDVSSWSVVNDPSLTSGAWEQADPNPTFSGTHLVAPDDDATPAGTMAFITENGEAGEPVGTSDVDGGPTHLISPVFNLEDGDAFVSYAYWIVSLFGIHDGIVVEVSNDGGGSWTTVETLADATQEWTTSSFLVGDIVTPTAQVRVRFSVVDTDGSATEAGIDDFSVTVLCPQACPADLDGDGTVAITDLITLLAAWGSKGGPEDIDGDGTVGITDLLTLLSVWGPCKG